MTPEPFVSAEEAAAFLSVKRRYLLELARRGIAGAYALDPNARRKVWVFRLSELAAEIISNNFGLHNLRHSLSNWLVNKAKVDPKTVQAILRHSKIQTTLDLYTQKDADEARAAQGAFWRRSASPRSWRNEAVGSVVGWSFCGAIA